jgi:hypothetical protein
VKWRRVVVALCCLTIAMWMVNERRENCVTMAGCCKSGTADRHFSPFCHYPSQHHPAGGMMTFSFNFSYW